MNSINFLEELRLKEYYPQKLTFGVAITFRGQSQNGCPRQYGLEIVRRLLMFDSQAVVSVTKEINKRIYSTEKTETETKYQSVSDGAGSTKKIVATLSRRTKLHPMDLLVVVMNCCDDFLRQVLVERMFTNKLSIPILLPDVRNNSHVTLLLLALKSLVVEVGLEDQIQDGLTSLTDILVDVRNPMVSFIRIGKLHRSKSKLVNYLLNYNSRDTFFHRDCPNGSAKRSVSMGSIEAAWFQSSKASAEEFSCKFFTALNFRGDASEYPKQTQFLCRSSTLTVFMVETFERFKELYMNVLKDVGLSQTKIIVCHISSECPDDADKVNFQSWNDSSGPGAICEVKCDWIDDEKMSDADFTNHLRETISNVFNPERSPSNQVPAYANISRSEQNLGFQLDEDKLEYVSGKASADEFVSLIWNQPRDCKPIILPLQGDPWWKIGTLEREQRKKSQDKGHDEHYIAVKETEKRHQREIQCRSLLEENKIAETFYSELYRLQEQKLLYYLNSCKIKLEARNRFLISNIIDENDKQNNCALHSCEGDSTVNLNRVELEMANSAIGLEHILRECGQMYEAVISERIRMKEELRNARLTPDEIRVFPTIVARLLLTGEPLELMDGDASNVPITWLRAVLHQITIMTKNAKVFVLSIIGVQSSGKSTLLNALFGLQFPVSAGRCTKGIYCHMVPIDKESLQVEYDYVLVVDTEGLGSSQKPENSTFRDNELATFAIGVADATIINMKGENWSEMKDILQIAAHGLIRVKKTKAELELMPRCMFVHQNVPAANAEKKNLIGQEKQLSLLNTAIKAAGRAEGLTEITQFNQVIKYDPRSHSWFFPDLWSDIPHKGSINQAYTEKVNELRQHLMQVMKETSSNLTISNFFIRMSDLWNAMLHNDFVLCFRNTQQIIACSALNNEMSRKMENIQSLSKLEKAKMRESISAFISIEKFAAEKDNIMKEVMAAVEANFTNMKATLQVYINATDNCEALNQSFEISWNALKVKELRRVENETAKVVSEHMKTLEYGNDQGMIDLKAKLANLEKSIEEVKKDKLNESGMKDFEERWQGLIADNKTLVDGRVNSVKEKIKNSIRGFTSKFFLKEKVKTFDFDKLFKTPLTSEIPQVADSDIVQKQNIIARLAMDLMYSKSYVYAANTRFLNALKKWESQFQNLIDIESCSKNLKEVTLEVGQLLGISRKEHDDVRSGTEEAYLILPPGYGFSKDYTTRFCEFACHYIYNRSLEHIIKFISRCDPLPEIGGRYLSSLSVLRLKTAKENINYTSNQIFDYAERSFVRDLGQLIEQEVCRADYHNPAFQSKSAFLRTILTDLCQETDALTNVNKAAGTDKQKLFKTFMLYVDQAESKESREFFRGVILKLLNEMLIKENSSDSDFEKIIKNSVGSIITNAENALMQAKKNCKECAKEYIRIFKIEMKIKNEIDIRINILDGFTEAVTKEIRSLYVNFLGRANYLFQTLVWEGNKAAIRPLFEKIMGCREKCPFCSAPCFELLNSHPGSPHHAIHYPTGVSGTVVCSHWLTSNIQETYEAVKMRRRRPENLALDNCQTLIGTPVDFRTKATLEKYNKWYHRLFDWNYHAFKTYTEIAEYENWHIKKSHDYETSLYWKWFMAKFDKELAAHYQASIPNIPKEWRKVACEEAIESLNEPDSNPCFYLDVSGERSNIYYFVEVPALEYT